LMRIATGSLAVEPSRLKPFLLVLVVVAIDFTHFACCSRCCCWAWLQLVHQNAKPFDLPGHLSHLHTYIPPPNTHTYTTKKLLLLSFMNILKFIARAARTTTATAAAAVVVVFKY